MLVSVAHHASNIGLAMFAQLPVRDDVGSGLGVALDALRIWRCGTGAGKCKGGSKNNDCQDCRLSEASRTLEHEVLLSVAILRVRSAVVSDICHYTVLGLHPRQNNREWKILSGSP
jgi:hypothetical protein